MHYAVPDVQCLKHYLEVWLHPSLTNLILLQTALTHVSVDHMAANRALLSVVCMGSLFEGYKCFLERTVIPERQLWYLPTEHLLTSSGESCMLGCTGSI